MNAKCVPALERPSPKQKTPNSLGFKEQDKVLELPSAAETTIATTIQKWEKSKFDDVFTQIQSIIENAYRASPLLAEQNLKIRYAQEQEWRSKEGEALANRLFLGNLANFDKTEKRFYWELAIDRMLGTSFPPSLQQKLIVMSLDSIVSPDFNVSFARPYQNLASENGLAPLIQSIRYESLRDAVDTQIVHMTLAGHKRGGQLYPVLSFTTEQKVRTENRLAAYSTLLKGIDTSFEKHFSERLDLKPGKVIIVDSATGAFKDEIRAEKFFE